MKLAIMQPYLFPYVGYFQLAAAVDKFVFYDDVNFIKNGWINRNRLTLSGAVRYFTAPLQGASPFVPICEVGMQPGSTWRRKILESIRHSYAKAPNFVATFALVKSILEMDTHSIGEMAKHSVVSVVRYLGLPTQFVWTSSAYDNRSLSGVERVLDICSRERASQYFNLPGGRSLYEPAAFLAAGIELHFIEPRLAPYARGSEAFHAGLSIIDALMWSKDPSAAATLLSSVTEVAVDGRT